MRFDPNIHHRRSIRLAGYDYRAAGGYFVTICAARKRCVFGKIQNGIMRLNPYGQIIETCWSVLPDHFAFVVLDQHVTMPNHFHGIIMLNNVGAQHAAPLRNVMPQSLSAVVRSFKSAVTKRINEERVERGLPKVVVWQRNFYERIIRDENELDETRRYIIENPLNWETDENYKP